VSYWQVTPEYSPAEKGYPPVPSSPTRTSDMTRTSGKSSTSSRWKRKSVNW